MGWFGSDDEEDDSIDRDDYEKTYVWEEHSIPFTKHVVEFTFIRGGSETITWHEYERYDRTVGHDEAKRGDVRVEQFRRIVGVNSVGTYGGEVYIEPEYVSEDEVTTINVAHREIITEEEMYLEADLKFAVWVDEDGNEVERMTCPRDSKDARIGNKEVEYDGE